MFLSIKILQLFHFFFFCPYKAKAYITHNYSTISSFEHFRLGEEGKGLKNTHTHTEEKVINLFRQTTL